jgi:hypothetical protein
MRIREAQKYMDPTDPDRQHCFVDYGHLAAMLDRARMKLRKRRQAGLLCPLCITIFLCHSSVRLLRLPFFLVIFLFGGKKFFYWSGAVLLVFVNWWENDLSMVKNVPGLCKYHTVVNSRSRIRSVWSPNIIDKFYDGLLACNVWTHVSLKSTVKVGNFDHLSSFKIVLKLFPNIFLTFFLHKNLRVLWYSCDPNLNTRSGSLKYLIFFF